MKKLLKINAVLAAANWFLSAIWSVYNINNLHTVEMFLKANPESKIETVSSNLKFLDVLLTRNHEWEAVWLLNGKRVKTRWNRTYYQPITGGVYYGLGSSRVNMIGFLDG